MRNKIVKVLSNIRPEYDFTQSKNFIEEGLLDSFDIFTLVNSLDDEFGISIDGVDVLAENFANLDKIIALLKKNGVE